MPAGLLSTSSSVCATVLIIESMHAVALSSALLVEQGSRAGPSYGRDSRPSALLIIRLGKIRATYGDSRRTRDRGLPEYIVVGLNDDHLTEKMFAYASSGAELQVPLRTCLLRYRTSHKSLSRLQKPLTTSLR